LTVDRDAKLPIRPPALQAPVAPETPPPAQDLPRPSYDQAVAAADQATQPQASPSAFQGTEGADGEALRQFRIAVARRVGQHDFPELADEIGAGNASVVRVVVGPAPGWANVSVARSSGHARLDAKARELIGAGVSATVLPDALRGREFVADFRIEFRPRNDAPRD
jgi:outer membrane biosynthesis protein TonB